MKSKSQLKQAINRNRLKVNKLLQKDRELTELYMRTPGRGERLSEGNEEVGRGKTKRVDFVKRIHWKEKFTDEDTGEYFYIERSKPIEINGVPVTLYVWPQL